MKIEAWAAAFLWPPGAPARLTPTGLTGLEAVLYSGLARNRLHLLEGSPGTGKTTIALQFLLAGAQVGEFGIYVSLAETEQEPRAGARSHEWTVGALIGSSPNGSTFR